MQRTLGDYGIGGRRKKNKIPKPKKKVVGSNEKAYKCSKKLFKKRTSKNETMFISHFAEHAELSEDGTYYTCPCSKHIQRQSLRRSRIEEHHETDIHLNYVRMKKEVEKKDPSKRKINVEQENQPSLKRQKLEQKELSESTLIKLRSLFLIIFFEMTQGSTISRISKYIQCLFPYVGVNSNHVPFGYHHHDVIVEIIIILGKKCLKYILSQFVDKPFSISADKATVQKKHLLSVSSYFLWKRKVPKKVFLEFVEVQPNSDMVYGANEICADIVDVCERNQLNQNNLVSYSSDRASDMVAAAKELKKKKRKFPLFEEFCRSHKIEKAVDPFLEFFCDIIEIIQSIYVYFSFSGNKQNLIKSFIGRLVILEGDKIIKTFTYITLKRCKDLTRWSGLYQALLAFKCDLIYLFEFFKKRLSLLPVLGGNKKERKEREKIKIWMETVFDYSFLYKLHVFLDISEIKNLYTKQTQDIKLSVFEVNNNLKLFKTKIIEYKTYVKPHQHLNSLFSLVSENKTSINYTRLDNNRRSSKSIDLVEGNYERSNYAELINAEIESFEKDLAEVIKVVEEKIDILFPNDEMYKHMEFLTFGKLKELKFGEVITVDTVENENNLKFSNGNLIVDKKEFGNESIFALVEYLQSLDSTSFNQNNEKVMDQWRKFKNIILKTEAIWIMDQEQFLSYILNNLATTRMGKEIKDILFLFEWFSIVIFTESGDETNFSNLKDVLTDKKSRLNTVTMNSIEHIRSFNRIYENSDITFSSLIMDSCIVEFLNNKKNRRLGVLDNRIKSEEFKRKFKNFKMLPKKLKY